MKRINILSILAAAALVMPMLAGCDDDDIVQTPLASPALSTSGSTASTLDFSWDKVDGATQYGYDLTDPDGNIVSGDVITGTTAHFTGLSEKTTYTLTVRAFAYIYGERTTSQVITLTGTTAARVPLDTPTGLHASMENGAMIVSWNSVANATQYYYTYSSGNGVERSSSTTGTSVALSGLSVGDYTFTIYAASSDYAYKESETAQFTFTRLRMEIGRVYGTYRSVVKQSVSERPAEMVMYDDGSYVIESWYGTEGYDLEFSVDSDDTIIPLNYTSYNESTGFYAVPSGDSECGDISIYHSYFDDESCNVWFYVSSNIGIGYDEFDWSSGEKGINDLAGSYTEVTTGQTLMNDWTTWQTLDYSNSDVTISVIDDTTIEIKDFYWGGSSIKGTVNLDDGTIYFAPQTMDAWYTFASQYDSSQGITATINSDGSISMSDWSMFYGGNYYLYWTVTKFTKN